MEVKLSRSVDQETPAGAIGQQLMENIASIMTAVGGIESIKIEKYVAGMGSRLHVSIGLFPKAPSEVANQGIIIKDALAQILSVANVTRAIVVPTDKELADLEKMWNDIVTDVRSKNAQINFGGGSRPDDQKPDNGDSAEWEMKDETVN